MPDAKTASPLKAAPTPESLAIQQLVSRNEAQSLIADRMRWNVAEAATVPDREEFWRQLVIALLTSQQRSTVGSPVSQFANQTTFPLELSRYAGFTDGQVSGILQSFRFHDRIAGYLRDNHNRLFVNDKGWANLMLWFQRLAEQRKAPPTGSQAALERQAASALAEAMRGVGPKQSRNILQELGLTRYEIPLDSRVVGWLCHNLGWTIKNAELSRHQTYDALLDRVQLACAQAGVLPTIFDAAAFTIGGERSTSAARTTVCGFVNQNGQVVIRNSGLPGTDHLQSVYQLGCTICGHVYGANGSDIHLRLCPKCQSGATGLPFTGAKHGEAQ
jgi:hypothetical protein